MAFTNNAVSNIKTSTSTNRREAIAWVNVEVEIPLEGGGTQTVSVGGIPIEQGKKLGDYFASKDPAFIQDLTYSLSINDMRTAPSNKWA